MIPALWACWALAWLAFLTCGGWSYAMHRAHDGDQHRYAGYAFIAGNLASAFGAAALIFGP